jgi:D-alanyl-D-alanine carboxypeptidase/D-alanyl-D-alanine-endopeptidase (penicillin-binding protein 4)
MGRSAHLSRAHGLSALTTADVLPRIAHVRRVIRSALAAACLAIALAPAASGRPTGLDTRLTDALAVPHAGLTAALAIDLRTGETLFHQRERMGLVPASNEKLAVAYTALVVLGPSYRIDTTVFGEGELIDGVWRGNLVLKGYGDPTLTSGDLRRLASQLRDGGLRSVTGAVVGDESYFDSRRVGPMWKPSFYVNESPPLSALTVDRARYGGIVTDYPALGAARAFRDALVTAGIIVRGGAGVGKADEAAFPLASVSSPPLTVLVRWMNRDSDNFMAELLLKQLGVVNRSQGTTGRGTALVRTTLAAAGVPLTGVRIVDGSGLSPYDRVTADALVGILRAAWEDTEVRAAFLASLPVAGVTGTLSDRLRVPPARGNVIAKTGTTSAASTLAGYVRKRFAFAVLNNGRPVSTYWARRAQDRFVAVLAAT